MKMASIEDTGDSGRRIKESFGSVQFKERRDYRLTQPARDLRTGPVLVPVPVPALGQKLLYTAVGHTVAGEVELGPETLVVDTGSRAGP